jgi:hypothetical protein
MRQTKNMKHNLKMEVQMNKLKVKLVRANGNQFNMQKYLDNALDVQDIEEWKNKYGSLWKCELENYLKENIVKVVDRMELVVTEAK